MINSQIVISRAFRRWRLRKLRKNNKYTLDVYFNTSAKDVSEVLITGEFTQEPWKCKIPMRYSHFFKWYTVRIVTSDWCMFKFIVDSQYVCSNSYQTFTTSDAIVNNVFKLNTGNMLTTDGKGTKRITSKYRKAFSKEETNHNKFETHKKRNTLKYTDSVKNQLFSFKKICHAINSNPIKTTERSVLFTNSTKYWANLRSPETLSSLKKSQQRKLSYNDNLNARNFDEKNQNNSSVIKEDTNTQWKCKNSTIAKKIKQTKSYEGCLNSANKLTLHSVQLTHVRGKLIFHSF